MWTVGGFYRITPSLFGLHLTPLTRTSPIPSEERAPEYSIFVGDLGPEVTEYVLVSLFQARFKSCKAAKIMTDAVSGQSRGYGFVRFSDQNDQQRALTEMQGVYCGNRPMRISQATPKNNRLSVISLQFSSCPRAPFADV